MPGRYDIYVFEDGGTFYTRPAVAMVKGGERRKLNVRNLTRCPITLKFPEGVLLKATQLALEPGKKRGVFIDPKADDIFDYKVQVRLTKRVHAPALGNSWPKIIVDA